MREGDKKKYKPEQIYRKALEGDEEAWEVIQLWVSKIIWMLNLNLRGEEPDDLVQIIILALLDKIEKGKLGLRSPPSFLKYLFKFSRDRIIDYSRKKEYMARIKSSFSIDDDLSLDQRQGKIQVKDVNPDQETLLKVALEWDYLMECLSELEESDRSLFYLKIQQEAGILNHDDIKVMDSINNLPVKFFRLKQDVKKCVEGKLIQKRK